MNLDDKLEEMLGELVPFQSKEYRGRRYFFLPGNLNRDELIRAIGRNGILVKAIGRNGIVAVLEFESP